MLSLVKEDIIVGKIQPTGILYDGDEPLFKQLILNEHEAKELIESLGSYSVISEKYKVDFISIQIDSEIDFIHLTSVDNESSIERLGLINMESNYVADLGKGIYVVDIYSDKGFDNLKDFIVDKKEEELLLIEGSYRGKMEVCVYGEGHEGYIVLHDNVSPDYLEFRTIPVDDFLLLDIKELQF